MIFRLGPCWLGVSLGDCGHKVIVAWKLGRRMNARRYRNPFRVRLSDADFYAGKPRWRWPVSIWAR